MKEKILKIDGMHCMGCTIAVKSKLEEINCVSEVEVDLDQKQAVIKYEDELDMQKVKEVVKNLGFEVVEENI